MSVPGETNPPSPAAVQRLAAFLRRRASGEELAFENWVATQPGRAGELRDLHAHWSAVEPVLESAGWEGSFSELVERSAGGDVDPRIELVSERPGEVAGDEIRTRFGLEQRFHLRGEVGSGGMGTVLHVWDEGLHRPLAMKVARGAEPGRDLPLRRLGRFLEEAEVTAQLDHPAIVPVHQLGLGARQEPYFTMKLVQGETLKQVFQRVARGEEGWTRTRALGLLIQVCQAVAYAHARGVVHRDLKPANVMVGAFGEVYVMDWGLARVLGLEDTKDVRIRTEPIQSARRELEDDTGGGALVTMDGDVLGTPAYMSPEQARGDLDAIGPASDVYSVGAMLFELLTGRAPYTQPGEAVAQRVLLERVRAGAPAAVRTLAPRAPADLCAVCERAMQRDPAARYADLRELAAELEAHIEGRVVRAYRTGALAELAKWVRRNRALAASLVAVLLVVAAGLVGAVVLMAEADAQRAGVLRLSAFQELELLEQEADGLWPARPENTRAFDDWLRRARALIAGLHPDAERGDVGHYRRLEQLAAQARPWTPEELDAWRRADPRRKRIDTLRGELASTRRAHAASQGGVQPEELELDLSQLPADGYALHALAWPLVEPGRAGFGREAEGLALARRARELASGEITAYVLDTLAWALFANGLDAEALEVAHEARALAPTGDTGLFKASIEELDAAVRGRPERLADLEEELAELEDAVSTPPPRFASDELAWWHERLAELVRRIEVFADAQTGLVDGVSPGRGWGVERRKAWAQEVRARSIDPEERARWDAALAAIAEHPAYQDLELQPQPGLLPIGPDPRSGLWEFAHLPSGTPAERGPDGRLRIDPGTGVVLVLVPAGAFWMGAQRDDPAGRNYDPVVVPDEEPAHPVELSAYFLSKYELTQAQWERLSGANPSSFPLSPVHPVEQVSWIETTRVLGWYELSLPTEAQWEYGARAGTDTPYWCGETPYLNGEPAGNWADWTAWDEGRPWGGFDPEDLRPPDGYAATAPVGAYPPNPFGLHEVLGNLAEMCMDRYDAEKHGADPAVDPVYVPDDSDQMVIRGGTFFAYSSYCRSAFRLVMLGRDRPDIYTGVRPARALDLR